MEGEKFYWALVMYHILSYQLYHLFLSTTLQNKNYFYFTNEDIDTWRNKTIPLKIIYLVSDSEIQV